MGGNDGGIVEVNKFDWRLFPPEINEFGGQSPTVLCVAYVDRRVFEIFAFRPDVKIDALLMKLVGTHWSAAFEGNLSDCHGPVGVQLIPRGRYPERRLDR